MKQGYKKEFSGNCKQGSMENELGCYRLGNSGKMKLIIKLSI